DVRLRVFNVDDDFGAALAARPEFAGRIACSSGKSRPAGAFVRAHGMQFDPAGTSFGIEASFGSASLRTALVGAFNVDNLLAVLAVLLGSGVGLARAVDACSQLRAPPGRLEVILV